MTDSTKDTIYIDIDDEITTIIDKVRATQGKVVALVLPKRASVLQSIVNMKLLKRTADNEQKNLVLITAEAGLLPLAGAVGLHVAKTLSSTPEIPSPPNMGLANDTETVDEDLNMPLGEVEAPDLTKTAAATATVGALADASERSLNALPVRDGLETLELDNEDKAAEDVVPLAAAAVAADKVKKDKNLKVPNFNRFRMLLLLGLLLLVGLIILAILAFNVWPKASIDIKTNASNVNTNLNLTLDSQAQTLSVANNDVPAKLATEQKTFTQTVNATGQKNNGNTASGNVTMKASDCNLTYGGNSSFIIPQGTGLSANSLTYITQQDTTMAITKVHSNGCIDYSSNGPTPITAQNPGANYNTGSGTTFTVSGYSGVTATGSTSGGTDSIVTVVTQSDINTATSKINSNDSATVKGDLVNQLTGEGLYPVDVTFTSGSPQTSSNPSVGDVSNSVTVTETVSYSLYGAKKSDLYTMIDSNIRSQTASSQNIISRGLNQLAFKQVNNNGTTDQVALSTIAEVGPDISVTQIKKESAGKSPQAIISLVKNNPDVTSVTVRLSPFWVSSAPSNTSKITVKVAKPSPAV